MATKTVPFSKALTFGWETFKDNTLFLLGLFVAVAVINGVVKMADEFGGTESWYFKSVWQVIEFVVNLVLDLGIIVIMLKFKDGSKPEFGDLFNRLPLVFPFAIASIIYAVMVIVGLIFLIVPGLYLAVRFVYFGYFIVDEGAGPIEALQKSSALTEGVRMDLFFFGAMMVGINILGLLALFVGVLVTCPITSLAVTHVFRHLQGASPAAPSETPAKAV